MDTLGIKNVPAGEQFVLYGMNVSKLCDSMLGHNTMQTLYFPTWEMARDVYVTLQYFIINWDRGYYGGELGSGVRRCEPTIVGVVPVSAIGSRLFTKINDEEMMNQGGGVILVSSLFNRSNELNKHTCNVTNKLLPKHMYDEHMLAVLRCTGFSPRIKRQRFTLNPFKYDYIETDETTVRKMGLVM
jgi:hypothetical protein